MDCLSLKLCTHLLLVLRLAIPEQPNDNGWHQASTTNQLKINNWTPFWGPPWWFSQIKIIFRNNNYLTPHCLPWQVNHFVYNILFDNENDSVQTYQKHIQSTKVVNTTWSLSSKLISSTSVIKVVLLYSI